MILLFIVSKTDDTRQNSFPQKLKNNNNEQNFSNNWK